MFNALKLKKGQKVGNFCKIFYSIMLFVAKCSQNSVEIQSKSSQNAAKCSQNSVEIQFNIQSKCSQMQPKSSQNAAKMQSQISQNAVRIQSKFS